MRRKLVLLLVLVSLATSLVGFFSYRARSTLSGASVKFDRVYKSAVIDPVRSFELPFHGVEIKVYRQRLFVHNASDRQIVEYDTMGNVMNVWGGKGGAAGEFQLIFAWDVDDKGVYVVDNRKLSITEMAHDGSITAHYRLRTMFFRAHRLSAKQYILKTMAENSPKRQIYRLLDISADRMITLTFRQPSVANDLSLDGFFTKNEKGTHFYISHRAAYFFSFDSRGNFLFQGETIDKTPPPPMLEGQGGTVRVDPKAKLINLSASVDENYLYILSRATSSDGKNKGVVDVYQIQNGKYLWSFVIPSFQGEDASAIAVGNNQLFAIQGQSIVYYRLQV